MEMNDYLSLVTFSILWIQPIFWMLFFFQKTTKLDRLAKFGMPTAMMFLGAVYLLRGLIPGMVYTLYQFPTLNLFMFYAEVGFGLAAFLMLFKNWHFPQAMSISVLVLFVGKFYWESPYLVTNAFYEGFKLDWLLHLMGLIFVWFIKDTVGWKTDRRTLGLVGLGFVSAILFMLGWYVSPALPLPPHVEFIWNSPYYILDRLVCILIAFSAIKLTVPVWRVKKVDNI